MVSMLQQLLGRTIVDKTDIKGLYDFKLTFSPEGLPTPAGRVGPPLPSLNGAPNPALPTFAADPLPSVFTAIQELGLRLESTRGPMEVLVIESVQKPTEN
jgi:bla regulator protein blaR1